MRSHRRGFTLVELVVIVAILGILVATALPRFTNHASDMRSAAAASLAAGLRSAVTLVQSRHQASGNFAATAVTMADGMTVATSAGATGGFPTAAMAGIGNAMRCESAKACRRFAWTIAAGVVTFTEPGAPAACNVTYDAATGIVTNNATTANC